MSAKSTLIPIPDTAASPPRAQSVDEFARYLGVAPLTIRREIARGHLKASHIGRRVILTPTAVSAYLKSGEVA